MTDLNFPLSPPPRLAIVGGGLAGMAAAVAAVERGLRVELFESRRRLGGRAGSFVDPKTGATVDHCQHVAMGCCTHWADFCRRTAVDDCFSRHRRLHFISPTGKQTDFAASRWLPAPLHLAPGLLRLRYLSLAERLGIARSLWRLARTPAQAAQGTVGEWLRGERQSPQAIERFWSVVLVSALGETVDRASLGAARKVFVDGFLAARRAYEVLIPRVTLGEIYDRRLRHWLVDHGVRVHTGARIRRIRDDRNRVTGIELPDGTIRPFDFVIAAVPWRRVGRLFDQSLRAALPALDAAEQIESSAITAAHLWFDRPITPLRHAALIGRLSQWLFAHGQSPIEDSPSGHYYQVVISASGGLAGRDRDEILAEVCDDLKAVFPAAADARLLHHRVVTHGDAVFSMQPGIEQLRPPQQTPLANLALAGDWTATGWPATMESAVRSGYLAMEAVLSSLEQGTSLAVPELPRNVLVRRLFGG